MPRSRPPFHYCTPLHHAMPLEWDPQSKIWRQKQMEETNGTEVEMGRGERGEDRRPKGKKTRKFPLLGDNRIKHILDGGLLSC